MSEYKLILGDCLEKLKDLEDSSVDSIVTDSPYGISFMGKNWDYDVPSIDIWKECLRVLKPGGHLLSFSSPRTYHRMAVNIEDAGFEIRDQIMWVYGSGFPKSHNVGKAIDKKLGCEREVVGSYKTTIPQITPWKDVDRFESQNLQTKGSSEWEGWGTALKPAHEPIVLARKPFKGDVASNVLEYGTGAINIDGCRVGNEGGTKLNPNVKDTEGFYLPGENKKIHSGSESEIIDGLGRWPANFIHDGSEEVVSLFPNTGSSTPSEKNKNGGEFPEDNTIKLGLKEIIRTGFDDTGSAARYFYCPKASKKDRNEGCEDLPEQFKKHNGSHNGKVDTDDLSARWQNTAHNPHPTVKPTDLMKYLCRLVTPENGIVLDPFMGSGSTGKAAVLEGFSFIGIELSEEYLNIAELRIKHAITKDE